MNFVFGLISFKGPVWPVGAKKLSFRVRLSRLRLGRYSASDLFVSSHLTVLGNNDVTYSTEKYPEGIMNYNPQ